MFKKLFTRLLTLAVMVVLGYFVFISTDMSTVPIEKSKRRPVPNQGEAFRGEGVKYKSFTRDGEEIVSGSSGKVVQTGESRFQLEEGLELSLNIEGKNYQVAADSYGVDDNGRQVMTADPGGAILLQIEEVTIETEGPLLYGKDGVFSTEAPAYFRMGAAHSRSQGLRYKPDIFLELQKDSEFFAEGPDGHLKITADHILFENTVQRGMIRNGTLTSTSLDGKRQTRLKADEIEILFKGGRDQQPFLLVQASLSGAPAHFFWETGDLASSVFDVCFDETGRWIEELITGADAYFTAQTQDGYRLFGNGGQLTLLVDESNPKEMIGRSPVTIEGSKTGGPALKLTGEKGVETQFVSGRAYNTRIFGTSSFRYHDLEGNAGILRLSHNERNIIFSEGAELWNESEKVRVTADEILITDWDLDEKEINAFKFVQVTYFEDTPQIIQSFGDEMKFRLPNHYIKLKGLPAKVNKTGLTVEASTIEITQIDEELFDLKADSTGNEEIHLFMVTEEGTSQISARKLDYAGNRDLLALENVIRAVLPGKGELSCRFLEVGLRDKSDKKVVDYIKATEDVLFKGTIEEDGEPKIVQCRADCLNYRQAEQVIHFLGKGKDVVLNHPSGIFRGRELTYNLNDGSIRGDSDKHGTTKTTINLKDNRHGNN